MSALDKADNSKKGEQKMSDKQKRENIDAAFICFSSACVDNPGK